MFIQNVVTGTVNCKQLDTTLMQNFDGLSRFEALVKALIERIANSTGRQTSLATSLELFVIIATVIDHNSGLKMAMKIP